MKKTPSFDSQFPFFLTLILITLKLCSVINWSGVWVLSPVWICAAFALLVYSFWTFYWRARK